MTPEQITTVKASWQQLRPVSEQMAFQLYTRLFELNPTLHELFTSDSREQGHKLVAMLDTAVASLDDFDALAVDIRDLGARHVEYGVESEHYTLFEDALHWALSQGLGERYTAEVAAAWRALFRRLSRTMGAEEAFDPPGAI